MLDGMRAQSGPVDMVRVVLGTLFLVFVVFLTIDVSVVMLHRINSVVLKTDYTKVFCFELGMCLMMLFCALDVRFGVVARALDVRFGVVARLPGWLRYVGYGLRALAVVCTLAVFLLGGKIVAGGLIRTEGTAPHAMVLGMALENGEPSADLMLRLDTANAYANERPDATLILTGGNPDRSGKTEADVMREILLQKGVSPQRIVAEDKAESTQENFQNVARLIDPAQPVVLVTSDYHMDRATRIAEGAGFTHVLRLPAPSDIRCYWADVMSEVALAINEIAGG